MSLLKYKGLCTKVVLSSRRSLFIQPQAQRSFHLLGNPNRKLQLEAFNAHFMQQIQRKQMSLRHHSTNNTDSDKKASQQQSDYEKSFQDLLGAAKASEQDKNINEDAVKQKKEMEQAAREAFASDKAKFEQMKQQQFEDLLSGKPQKRTDDMNLQELFKEYYDKIKNVDKKEYISNAKSTITSRLELRKSIFKKQAQQHAEEEQKTKEQQASQTQDKSTEAEAPGTQQEQQTAQQQEQTSEQQQQDAQKQAEEAQRQAEQAKRDPAWHETMRTKFSESTASFGQTLNEKYPKTHSAITYFKDVWQETFPNETRSVKSKLEQRRKLAKMEKEMEENQEYIDQIQENIPEWKRGAVVISDQATPEEKGLFKKLKNKVKGKLTQTEAAKQFLESEDYKKIKAAKSELDEFKSNLKEQIDQTQNPAVQISRDLAEKAFYESSTARAIKDMQRYDPSFDIQALHYEVEEVFTDFFSKYLEGDLPYLEKICGGPGLAVVKGQLKVRQTEGWKYLETELLDCNHVTFTGAQIPEKQTPQFAFTFQVQEIDCKVDIKDENVIKEGSLNNISSVTYRVVFGRHDNPDIALVGHYWEIVEFNILGKLEQIV